MYYIRVITFCYVVLAVAATASSDPPQHQGHQADVLDIISSKASAAIAIRNAKTLGQRGDVFIDKTGAKILVRPTEAFRWLTGFLGIQEGVDDDGAFALMHFGDEYAVDALVLAVPISDIDAMADDFGIDRNKLQSGETIDRKKHKSNKSTPFTRYIVVHDDHLYLGQNAEYLSMSVEQGSLRSTIPATTRDTLSDDDIIFYASGKLAQEPIREGFTRLAKDSELTIDETETLDQLLDTARDVKHIVLGVRLDGGLGATLQVDFDGAASKSLLGRLGRENESSTMDGLPDGRFVAGHASIGKKNDKAAFPELLVQLLRNSYLVKGNVVAGRNQSILPGLLGDAWRRADGSRSVLLENENPNQNGLFSLVVIVDTDDAEEFVGGIQDLARFAKDATQSPENNITQGQIDELVSKLGDDRYQTRQSASIKLELIGPPAVSALKVATESDDLEVRHRSKQILRKINEMLAEARSNAIRGKITTPSKPMLTFHKGGESHLGQTIDHIDVRYANDSPTFENQMLHLFGPDWNTIRIASIGKQVVFICTSDSALVSETILAARSRRPSSIGKSAHFRKRVKYKPTAEFHISMNRVVRLLAVGVGESEEAQRSEGGEELPASITSMGLSIQPQRLRIDLFAPFEELVATAKAVER